MRFLFLLFTLLSFEGFGQTEMSKPKIFKEGFYMGQQICVLAFALLNNTPNITYYDDSAYPLLIIWADKSIKSRIAVSFAEGMTCEQLIVTPWDNGKLLEDYLNEYSRKWEDINLKGDAVAAWTYFTFDVEKKKSLTIKIEKKGKSKISYYFSYTKNLILGND